MQDAIRVHEAHWTIERHGNPGTSLRFPLRVEPMDLPLSAPDPDVLYLRRMRAILLRLLRSVAVLTAEPLDEEVYRGVVFGEE